MHTIFEASSKKIAIRHPLKALQFYLGRKDALQREIILNAANYLWGNKTDLNLWLIALQEIADNNLIAPEANLTNIPVGNSLGNTFGKWLYCCVRVFQPATMIETGVAHGSSSWIILNAMHKNGHGKLISIDLPNNDTNAAYNFGHSAPPTGWRVPDILKSKWSLRLGDARVLLPESLKELGQLDFFFHDSDHSYSHMKFEFETILPWLSAEGVLLSDDVHKNNAFRELVINNDLKALQFNKGGCAIKR